MGMRRSVGGLAIFAAFGLDQLSKFWMLDWLSEVGSAAILPFFNLSLGFNTGVSFSLFAGLGQGTRWTLVAIAVGAAIFLSLLLWRTQSRLEMVGYGLMIGSALGNALDRVRLGAVVDFLDLHANGRHWPTFNLADSFLLLGVVLLLVVSRKPVPEPAR